jgi:hypothetical protein
MSANGVAQQRLDIIVERSSDNTLRLEFYLYPPMPGENASESSRLYACLCGPRFPLQGFPNHEDAVAAAYFWRSHFEADNVHVNVDPD